MRNILFHPVPSKTCVPMLAGLALAMAGLPTHAAENYKLRQAPLGAFGGEIAAGVDNPGLFGTASLTYLDIYKIVDANGKAITTPAIAPIPLNSTYSVTYPASTLNVSQSQTQLNLVGGYLTENQYANGRVAFAVNVPLIAQNRNFAINQPAGTITPTPTSPVPGPLTAGAGLANSAVQSRISAANAAASMDVTGFGDTEVSAVWVRHQDRLKVAAGMSVFVPTGAFDIARNTNKAPNPGFGNFYTIRPGVAVTYNLNPNHMDTAWDAGVTVAGRLSYGINTENKDTKYMSGDFVYAEIGAVKVSGNWAFGTNLFLTQQVTDDRLNGVTIAANRYKTYGFGPFLSYKLPGKDAGFNLQYSDNFGGVNAIVARSLQLRFVKAW
jgi:hypothetical protein